MRSHLAALLVTQLAGARSLREVEAAMATNATAFSRLGVEPAARSTLADANRFRPAAVVEALVPPLLARLPRQRRRDAKDVLRLIDATPIKPPAGAADWAHFQDGLVGAKIHVVYDPNQKLPVFFQVSAGNCNDITVAKAAIAIEPGATYVFDLGYYDFGFWAKLNNAQCRFVTRVKRSTRLTQIETRTVPKATPLRSDRIVMLPARQAKNRKNPFAVHGREILVEIDTGKTIALFTNDLTSSAQDIADLYKMRWQIELFFRWIKQNLRIRSFLGTSQNAVRLQVAAAIVAYIILRIMHSVANSPKNIQIFTAVIRQSIFQRLSLLQIAQRLCATRIRHPFNTTPQLAFI